MKPSKDIVVCQIALAIVTAVWLALHTYELVCWREARAQARSVFASS